MRPASRQEIVDWDALVVANPDGGHFLQTRAWGEFKRRWGWTPSYWIQPVARQELAILFLRRRVAAGEIWYAPKGPGVTETATLVEALADRSAVRAAFLVQVEPEIDRHALDSSALTAAGMVRARTDIQMSQATIIVPIGGDEEQLLASFKPKTRYNIRLAARRGVTVSPVPASDANVAVMYSLMAATQQRAGFVLRSRHYFAEYWQLFAASGQGQLFFASYRGQVLAGLFACHLGEHGWYKDGGSTKEHSELMAPHLLQWEVMRWLRQRGVRTYDMVAVPASNQLNEQHPLFGLYRFKSGFNETITEFAGTWDLPLRPRAYALWRRFGERATQRALWRLRGESLY